MRLGYQSANLAPDVAPELAAARGAAGQLGPAVGADEVAGVALQDRGQHIVETDRALNMVRLLLIVAPSEISQICFW